MLMVKVSTFCHQKKKPYPVFRFAFFSSGSREMQVIKIKIREERARGKYYTETMHTDRSRCTNLMSKLVSFTGSLNMKIYD